MQQKVAFFDIDGTVFRSSLFIELIEKLVADGDFPESAAAEYEVVHKRWLNREGSYEAYIEAMITTFMNHIKGLAYGVLADAGTEMIAVHQKRVYRYTRDLIRKLKAEGYYVVAISQSPKTILDEFCKSYGFDKVYGRMYEVDANDCFTGTVTAEEVIKTKANIVTHVLEKEWVTQEGSLAVGDTEGDISMFESVATPICFNPNKRLYDHAQKMGWKVVVERKDVIYEM